jgi:hypothetical protein
MSKWIRLENNVAQEIITYDPNGVINETFLPKFKGPFEDNFSVSIGQVYNSGSNTFSDPPIVPVSVPEPTPDPEPEPIYISLVDFRAQLTLSEKLTWDNPGSATTVQGNAINTVRSDFPQRVDGNEFREELDLLESVEVLGSGRSGVLLSYFSSL